MREFYIYVLFRPDGSPCYVGKGSGDRWRRHARKSQNPDVAEIIRAAGGELPVVKIRDRLSERQAFDLEVIFIAAIGRTIHGGPLLNLSNGGQRGAIGAIRTPETRAKIRAALQGKAKSPEHIAAMRGPRHPMTREQRADISRRQTGKPHSPEWNAAIGRGNRNSPKHAAHCKAIGDAQRGIPKGPCTEARREAARKGMLAYHVRKRAMAGGNL